MRDKIINDYEIMNQILDVRYTDLNEEKKLCQQLLELSEKKQNSYGRAFAYVYLFDSVLALGEYDVCDDYLSQAIYLTRKHSYDKLLMTLCNFGGLYYIRLNDEPTALQYFLDGIQLANELNDRKTSGMLYNNIGLCFAGRGEWQSAKTLFDNAVSTVYRDSDKDYEQKIISYLSNFAESCLQTGEMEEARKALEQCDSLKNEELYYKIRIGCEWSSYFAKTKQTKKCIQQAQMMLDLKVEEYNNKYFICDMVENISMSLLSIQEYKWAKRFVEMLEKLAIDSTFVIRYRAECAKIRYLEAIGEDASESYRAYYSIKREMTNVENEARLQSILSIIQLHELLKERDEIQQEKEVLENVMQLDELTGLYNRRYFNKLTTKITSVTHTDAVGIIMIDVDYFKEYNDRYGHFKGDEVLRCIGKLLKVHAIDGISPCRYGGDEFVCFAHDVSSKEIDDYVGNVYEGMKQEDLIHEGAEKEKRVTLSIGYAICGKMKDVSMDELLSLADQALYKAKAKGRNTYCKKEL